VSGVCPLVSDAAAAQEQGADQAVNGSDPSAVRAGVAKSLTDFAVRLRAQSAWAAADLQSALGAWAQASDEIARFLTTSEYPPDVAIGLGAGYPRWLKAKKEAETICGHALPKK
jgi:hypothetical protein